LLDHVLVDRSPPQSSFDYHINASYNVLYNTLWIYQPRSFTLSLILQDGPMRVTTLGLHAEHHVCGQESAHWDVFCVCYAIGKQLQSLTEVCLSFLSDYLERDSTRANATQKVYTAAGLSVGGELELAILPLSDANRLHARKRLFP
jgi:hypothetical protein